MFACDFKTPVGPLERTTTHDRRQQSSGDGGSKWFMSAMVWIAQVMCEVSDLTLIISDALDFGYRYDCRKIEYLR